ncbi:hypothetical protein E2562_023738 [Oryza meyeriana var. granulata]|uniref:Uncharacterized protein n=1 Tax=Oryza meyeriana var. granulata TaxID=110450 RepID=A0A6G1DMK9_9ORYZ|nr:hypothetical protein E2562_023738 [Oryza meyeriana var. granulata]
MAKCGAKVCAAGDAFCPMTPELSQGGCSMLQNGVILTLCLSKRRRHRWALEKYNDGQKDGREEFDDSLGFDNGLD